MIEEFRHRNRKERREWTGEEGTPSSSCCSAQLSTRFTTTTQREGAHTRYTIFAHFLCVLNTFKFNMMRRQSTLIVWHFTTPRTKCELERSLVCPRSDARRSGRHQEDGSPFRLPSSTRTLRSLPFQRKGGLPPLFVSISTASLLSPLVHSLVSRCSCCHPFTVVYLTHEEEKGNYYRGKKRSPTSVVVVLVFTSFSHKLYLSRGLSLG